MQSVLFKMMLLAIVGIAGPGRGSEREAAGHVEMGIRKHRSRDFPGAEQAFSAADSLLPNDARILFDRGCALAAQGKYDEAEKQFERAKLSRDRILNSDSLYNLGCLASARAKAKFGDRPEEASPDVRTEGLQQIEKAVAQYRAAISVNPQHAASRHNLELLRLWVKQMREIWKQRDRAKRRQELGLLEFLEMLQAEQSSLRAATRSLGSEEDSPRRRQGATRLGQSQRELSEEIAPLREKLREALLQTSQKPGSAATLSPDMEQAEAAFTEWTQQAQNAMARAATDLASNLFSPAEESQTLAIASLNSLYQAIAPFEHLLRKTIHAQERLIPATQELAAAWSASTKPLDPRKSPDRAAQVAAARDLPQEQRRVAGWAGVLKPKAEQAIVALKSQPAVAGPAPPPGTGAHGATSDPTADRAATQAAYELALKHGPLAETAATAAADKLDQRAWSDAKPKEEETLQLLKEIENRLPKPPKQEPPKQEPPMDDQDQEDSPDKSQNNSQNSPQPDNTQQDQPPPDASQQKEQGDKSADKDRAKSDASRQQAETFLRQVREREKAYHDQRKKRQAILGVGKVKRDW